MIISAALALALGFGGAASGAEASPEEAGTAQTEITEQETQTEEETGEAEAGTQDGETEEAETEESARIVSVDGEEIPASEIEVWETYMLSIYEAGGYDTDSEDVQDLAYEDAVNMAVQLKVIEKKAGELGLDQFTEEEEEEMRESAESDWQESLQIYTSLYQVQEELSEEEAREKALEYLESCGYATSDELFQQRKQEAVFTRVEEYCCDEVTVSDEEVEASYEEQAAADEEAYEGNIAAYEENIMELGDNDSFYVPTGYRHILHIRLEADEDLLEEWNEASEEEDQETMQQLEEELKASCEDTVAEIRSELEGGADIWQVIEDYSADSGLEDYTGYSVHEDSVMWNDTIKDAVFSLDDIGELSEPVVDTDGIYLLYYDSNVEGGAIEYTDTVAENLRESLLSEKQSQAFSQALQEWMADCEIVM